MARLIAFDLEGPLSPNDNAYELMGLFPRGDRVFEVISRYDDLLTLEGKEGYEPGDTLALILPFLVHHGITDKHILALAEKAGLVPGAQEIIGHLHSQGWEVFCITTTYRAYAHYLAHRLGIPQDKVICTAVSLDAYRDMVSPKEVSSLESIERELLALRPVASDARIKARLDPFYWGKSGWGRAVQGAKPMGGRRKLAALERFAREQGQPISSFVVVGDSITDARMLEAVNKAGGLAIAFNANEYALPYATLGLASTHISDLQPVLHTWAEAGRQGVEEMVKERERVGGSWERGHFHWLAGRKDLPLELHKRLRRLVRSRAGELG